MQTKKNFILKITYQKIQITNLPEVKILSNGDKNHFAKIEIYKMIPSPLTFINMAMIKKIL